MARFDLLATVHELEAADLSRRQAEAVAAACRAAAEAESVGFATRADLEELESRLRSRVTLIVLIPTALIVGLLIAVLERLP